MVRPSSAIFVTLENAVGGFLVRGGANMAQGGAKMGFDRRDLRARQRSFPALLRALNRLFVQHYRREQSQSDVLSLKNQTVGSSTDLLVGGAPIAALVGAFLGCLTTLHLAALGMLPAIASAFVTVLLCGLVVYTTRGVPNAFFPALYGGTFGGMTTVLSVSEGAPAASATMTDTLFILLSTVCGFTFFIVAKLDARSAVPIASGFGGRSGAIATVASLAFVQLDRSFGSDAGLFHGARFGTVGIEPGAAALEFFACMVGIVATLFVLRRNRIASADVADRTFVASAVAFIGLFILYLADPDDTRMLDAFYAGCFLGTSTPERLKGWIQPVFGAVVLTVVLALVRAFLAGLGGGLGLAAFVTVAMLVALSRATSWITGEMPLPSDSFPDMNPGSSRYRFYLGPAEYRDPRDGHGVVGDSERYIVIDQSRIWQLLERFRSKPLSGSRDCSTFGMLARFGGATVHAAIAAFVVIGSLLHWHAASTGLARQMPNAIGRTASAPTAVQSVRPPPQLVVAKATQNGVDDLIALGISLINADNTDAVLIDGLPSGANVTNGRPSGPGRWHLFAYELVNAAIRPAPGFVGAAEVAVELRRADQTVDRRRLHFEWTNRPPQATSEVSAPAIFEPSTKTLGVVTEDHELIFRKFLEWQANRSIRHPRTTSKADSKKGGLER
jgi:hypothetical protein